MAYCLVVNTLLFDCIEHSWALQLVGELHDSEKQSIQLHIGNNQPKKRNKIINIREESKKEEKNM